MNQFTNIDGQTDIGSALFFLSSQVNTCFFGVNLGRRRGEGREALHCSVSGHLEALKTHLFIGPNLMTFEDFSNYFAILGGIRI